jgi:hypothetical protein
VPKYLTTEETLGKNQDEDQHRQNRKDSGKNTCSASKKITRNKNREVIEVEDNGLFFDKIGSGKRSDEYDTDKNLLKMSYKELSKTIHNLSPLQLLCLKNDYILPPLKRFYYLRFESPFKDILKEKISLKEWEILTEPLI